MQGNYFYSLMAALFFNNGVIIIFLTIIFAYFVRYIFQNLLKNLMKKTKSRLDDKIVSILVEPVFWTVFLLGLYFFLQTLKWSIDIKNFSTNLLLSIGAAIWGMASINILRFLIREYDSKHEDGRLSDAIPFIENLIVIGVIGIVILLALDAWGINITPLLASAGVAGLGVAFAAKDSVSNLFGGISVFLDKPYKVGDYVIIRDQYRGEVTEIGMRSTKIRTRDNVLITIPNSVMVTDAVINETGFDPKLRIRIPIGIAYGSDLENVEYLLLGLLKKHESVLNNPEPRVRYRNFGNSSVELEALAVIDKPAHKGKVIHELIKEIHRVFKEENITIPFPQRDVYLHN
jgi:MscS family membrane protein